MLGLNGFEGALALDISLIGRLLVLLPQLAILLPSGCILILTVVELIDLFLEFPEFALI